MLAFQALFDQLDQVTGTRAKVLLLVEHFRSVPVADAAWCLVLLLGKQRLRLQELAGECLMCKDIDTNIAYPIAL